MHTTTRHGDAPPLAAALRGGVAEAGAWEPWAVAHEPWSASVVLLGERRLGDLVRSGRPLTEGVRAVAHAVAAFHARARSGPHLAVRVTRPALGLRWEDHLGRARAANHPALDVVRLDEVARLARRFLDGRGDLLEDRVQRGAIMDGGVDRLDDIAFLAMGLDDLGASDAAALLLDVWADDLGDPAPASLIHHYLAYRAFVRAEVGARRGAGQGAEVGRSLDTALAHLRAGAVQLVLVGGPPNTGKSTLAGAVADRFGVVLLSSDRIRREIADRDPWIRTPAEPGTGLSTAEHTRATYAAMLERADRLLRRGESVVLDATWSDAAERERAAALARRVSADLVELRCELDERTAQRRLVTRHSPADGDPTPAPRPREADPWPSSHVIDTGTTLASSTERACALVRPHPAPALVPVRLAATAG